MSNLLLGKMWAWGLLRSGACDDHDIFTLQLLECLMQEAYVMLAQVTITLMAQSQYVQVSCCMAQLR